MIVLDLNKHYIGVFMGAVHNDGHRSTPPPVTPLDTRVSCVTLYYINFKKVII